MSKKKQKQYQFEVLRTGKFTDAHGTDVVIDNQFLNDLASSYDSKQHPSPLVAGHPQDNHPALGWADSLKVVGNKLIAFTSNIHENLLKAVKDGSYKKISLSIFNADSPSNPVQGMPYVRHVGFLGATAPAVPGLEPLSFKADEKGVTLIEFSTQNKSLTQRIKDILTEILPKHSSQFNESSTNQNTPNEDNKMTPEEIAKLQADFAASQAKVTTLEADLKALKESSLNAAKEARNKNINDFCEQAIKKGVMKPADKDSHIAIMQALPNEEIEFSEEKTTALKMYQDNLMKKPKILNFKEKSQPDGDPDNPVNFSAPRGESVSTEGLDNLAKAKAYANKHNVSLSEAAQAVGA